MSAVAGLVQQGDAILLVRQKGPDDRDPSWALPGGVVEPRESILQALSRELREETGIQVKEVGPLLYVCELFDEAFGDRPWPNFVFQIAAWEGEARASGRDKFVLEARFVPRDQVAALISRRPPVFRFMYEPVVHWLQGRYDRGAFYRYRIKGRRARRLHGP